MILWTFAARGVHWRSSRSLFLKSGSVGARMCSNWYPRSWFTFEIHTFWYRRCEFKGIPAPTVILSMVSEFPAYFFRWAGKTKSRMICLWFFDMHQIKRHFWKLPAWIRTDEPPNPISLHQKKGNAWIQDVIERYFVDAVSRYEMNCLTYAGKIRNLWQFGSVNPARDKWLKIMNKIVTTFGSVLSDHPKRYILCIMMLEVSALVALMLNL